MRILLFISVFILSIFVMKCSNANNDIILENKSSIEIIEPDFIDIFSWIDEDDIVWNDVLRYAFGVIGTPYLWGGNSWQDGIDCSHFTWKMFVDNSNGYNKYMTTLKLSRINKKTNGLIPIYFKHAAHGDLLVFGSDNAPWKGHVVILVDKLEKIVVGSHAKIGVQFIKFDEFPNKYNGFKLKKILRVVR